MVCCVAGREQKRYQQNIKNETNILPKLITNRCENDAPTSDAIMMENGAKIEFEGSQHIQTYIKNTCNKQC